VGAELFLADRPTDGWKDMTQVVAFFAILKTPKKWQVVYLILNSTNENGRKFYKTSGR
jgi:hypothetical protein